MVTDSELALRIRMRDDLPFYAEQNLKILHKRPGEGKVPFIFNRAQRHVHAMLEQQLKDVGKVRALVLKARQQGCSTYTAARFFQKVTHQSAVNAYVLSHAMDTTKILFLNTRRFYDNCMPQFKPATRAASEKELAFSGLDSTFFVGTAGAKETGRGGTIQYFHGSEVAFWPAAETHFAGVMQSIPTGVYSKGTEIILESTANGPAGKFYELCMEAQKSEGEYRLIFTPWYWQEDYRSVPPTGWDWKEQDDYEMNRCPAERYDLDQEQIYWMHLKRKELTWDWLFKQEYPTTVDEAFQTHGEASLIPIHIIEEALPLRDLVWDENEPRIASLDPAGASGNADRSGIGHRQGRIFENLEYMRGKNTMQLAKIAEKYIEEWKIDRMFIDVQGMGVGVYDRMREDGYKKTVRACNFASGSEDMNPDGTKKYERMRDQCWGRMLEWFLNGPVQIPNLAELRADLTAPGYDRDKGRLKLESKRDMRKRGIKSPDGGDVLAMTFTEKVSKRLLKQKTHATVMPNYDILRLGI